MVFGKILFSIGLCLLTLSCCAQFMEGFDDQQLTSDPAWIGETSKFVIADNRLRLQAPVITGFATIQTACTVATSASWEFYFQMDFNPSSANYLKVYLISDQENLLGPLHGYFLKAGENDDVSLFRQEGTEELRIIDGPDGRLNLSQIRAKVRVLRDVKGTFQLFTDVGLSGTWTLEGISQDQTFLSSKFFGIICSYTPTRSDKFWFDDFEIIKIPVTDDVPPAVQVARALNDKELELIFSEELLPDSSINPRHFRIDEVGFPTSIKCSGDTIRLALSEPMISGKSYQLTISGIADVAGNLMPDSIIHVRYYQEVDSYYKDIILTEIMADPNPQVGLPDGEFVEIYNRSGHALDLSGWKLSDGSSTATLPELIVGPAEYLLLCDVEDLSEFRNMGQVIGLKNFPTLNNSGDNLFLKNKINVTIDSVSYDLTWYRDTDKAEGGWTLELIDPFNPCGEKENWVASEDFSGGTPGRKNSVDARKPDLTGPTLESVTVESSRVVRCQFNERLDTGWFDSNFKIFPSGKIVSIAFADAGKRTVDLELAEPLGSGLTYTLHLARAVDCNGNASEPSEITFGLPELPEPGDLLINEILFNPKAGGVDFIELYNTSNKFISTEELKLANLEDHTPGNIKPIMSKFLLKPNSYAVFTPDPIILKGQYPFAEEPNLHSTDLPGLPDDEGSVVIMNGEGRLIDALQYSREWHSPFIQDESGVSLERISWLSPTQSSDNWLSSSSGSGFATPGYINAQHRSEGAGDQSEVSIIPEVFAPGLDPNGFVQIKYQFNQPGMMVSISIIDPQGHPLKKIADSEWVGQEGFFKWDGHGESGQLVRWGYYLVLFEAFDSAGQVKIFRKRVVVASR